LAQSLSSVAPELRAHLYQEFAADAMRRAQGSDTEENRLAHMSMAAGWHSLAVDLEHSLGLFYGPD
jgi:hypothetical protein